MNAEELGRLVQEGLVEVGSHCVTHASLTAMDQEHRQKEIRGSKVELDTLTRGRYHPLAYPHGEFDRGVLEARKTQATSVPSARIDIAWKVLTNDISCGVCRFRTFPAMPSEQSC